MTEVELPYPTTFTDDEVKQVLFALEVSAPAFKDTVVDKPTNDMAALAASLVELMRQRIDARRDGVAFRDITPEDFDDAGSAGNGSP